MPSSALESRSRILIDLMYYFHSIRKTSHSQCRQIPGLGRDKWLENTGDLWISITGIFAAV